MIFLEEDTLWQAFIQSGSVLDYIAYFNAKDEVKDSEVLDRRTDYPGESLR